MKRENDYQAGLIKRLKDEFPGCVILKNDPNYIQGFPDLTILYEDKWAVLEVKRSKNATHQPNQDYYIDKLNEMSYASFVYPEIERKVMNDIREAFGVGGETRILKSKPTLVA